MSLLPALLPLIRRLPVWPRHAPVVAPSRPTPSWHIPSYLRQRRSGDRIGPAGCPTWTPAGWLGD